jgi:hypothetical protein
MTNFIHDIFCPQRDILRTINIHIAIGVSKCLPGKENSYLVIIVLLHHHVVYHITRLACLLQLQNISWCVMIHKKRRLTCRGNLMRYNLQYYIMVFKKRIFSSVSFFLFFCLFFFSFFLFLVLSTKSTNVLIQPGVYVCVRVL